MIFNLSDHGEFQVTETLDVDVNEGAVAFLGTIGDTRSILKFHKMQLPILPQDTNPTSLVDTLCSGNAKISLESDSGAEYKYLRCDAPGLVLNFKVECISPCTDRQIERCRRKPFVTLRETGELYLKYTKPWMDEILSNEKSLQWLYNIIEGKKEQELVLLDFGDTDNGFLISVSPKWHNPSKDTMDDLRILILVKRRDLHSMRDLRDCHLPLLKEIVSQSRLLMKSKFDQELHNFRLYVHYLPQFFHFHVHLTSLQTKEGVTVERAHLLDDIIENIESDPEYYAKRPLTMNIFCDHELAKNLA